MLRFTIEFSTEKRRMMDQIESQIFVNSGF